MEAGECGLPLAAEYEYEEDSVVAGDTGLIGIEGVDAEANLRAWRAIISSSLYPAWTS